MRSRKRPRKNPFFKYPWGEAEEENRPIAEEGSESLPPKKPTKGEEEERCPFCKAEYKGSLLKHIEDCPDVIRFKE